MIISTNKTVCLPEFEKLMKIVTDKLNIDSKKRTSYYLKRNAQLLEDDVYEWLNNCAENTPFANTIYKASGQKFPDIVARKYYGVEVKSSKDDKWTTIGGSVNESTRIEGVERIFLTFGKLYAPIEFRTKRYEDCLSGIAVTHYPRYKVDMNLLQGETIFEKMNITYDELRHLDDPVGDIVRHYKSQLKNGERLWWAGTEDAMDVGELKIRIADNLTIHEKQQIVLEGIAFFPEIFGSFRKKYKEFALWMAAERRIVSTSTRDFFSASGQGTIITETASFEDMPQIVVKTAKMKDNILKTILEESDDVLIRNWRVDKIQNDRLSQWIELVESHCKNLGKYPTKKVLHAIF